MLDRITDVQGRPFAVLRVNCAREANSSNNGESIIALLNSSFDRPRMKCNSLELQTSNITPQTFHLLPYFCGKF
jgi:hypothetical protein